MNQWVINRLPELVSDWGVKWVSEWVMIHWGSEWLNEWVSDSWSEWRMHRIKDWGNVWIRDWVTEGVNELLREWVSEWMTEWLGESLREWVTEWVTDIFKEWLGEWETEEASEGGSGYIGKLEGDCMYDWLSDDMTDRPLNCYFYNIMLIFWHVLYHTRRAQVSYVRHY